MTAVRRTAGLIAVALGAVLLVGCNDEEAARPIHMEKGVYRGASDTPLGSDTVQALQQRSAGQRF